MTHPRGFPGSDKPLLLAIAVLLVLYVGLLAVGLPQKWTQDGAAGKHAARREARVEHAGEAGAHRAAVAHESHGAAPGAGARGHQAETEIRPPPLWMVTPFVLLLGAIALFPQLPWTEHWWESNLSRFCVAAGLGCLTLLYYLVLHASPVEQHWPHHHVVANSPAGLNFRVAWAALVNAIFHEYVPFVVLLLSLYTISGGIRIEGDLGARPWNNTLLIGAGGLLASLIGTTGAAMLLIRPLLEANRRRKHVRHTVVFFIFVVCNCGGCLLPIGDPPLFLGYLRGVHFLWTLVLWPHWLLVNGILLAVYFAWDHFVCFSQEDVGEVTGDDRQGRGIDFSGLWPNGPLLLGVVLAVALLDPGKTLPGTEWHPWYFLREIAQLGLVALSLIGGSRAIRLANHFTYDAILEVAALFFGIFLCMQVPLQILQVEGPQLGLSTPAHFFWLTGSLSSLLDNAPAYLVFFETARALTAELGLAPAVAGVGETLLVGISLGAVFMGAMTYIGNGPNFMVKAIAETSGVRMPSFFGYMLYSCAILLPVLILHMLALL